MNILLLALAALLPPFCVQPGEDGPDEVRDSLSTIIINATRAGSRTPVTRTELSLRDMDLPSDAASLPRTLGLQTSVISTTEGANPLGYSSMRIRGVTGYATNVTLNGITLNDAESQEVFWVNIPSLSTVASSVQIQRGLGTSSSGPGAFGASINLSCAPPAGDRIAAEGSVASFGTRGISLAIEHLFRQGRQGKGGTPFLQLDIARAASDGYIRDAGADVGTIYACAGWRNSRTMFKGTFLMGSQHTGITWEGVPHDIFPTDPRYNACPGASDNFRQSHYQMSASHDFGSVTWTGTLNLTDGSGYYEYPGADGTRDYTESLLGVLRSELIWSWKGLSGTSGIYLSRYGGAQHETPVDGSGLHFYDNSALKTEQDCWTRAEWEKGPAVLYADLHLRAVQHSISGTDWGGTIPDVDKTWLFFSPRAGVSLRAGEGGRVYGSIARGHREPARSDILASEARPEHLTDFEAGYEMSGENFSAGATLYAMEYRDLLMETGLLSVAGYAIKANVPRGFRRGLELTASSRIGSWMDLDANLTLSRNRMEDGDGSWGDIVLSPAVVSALKARLHPLKGISGPEIFRTMELASETKYVGKQHWSAEGVIPSYCVTDLSFGFKWKTLSLTAFMVNVSDLRYYAGAYEGGVYPQAPRSFSLRLGVDIQ